MSTQLPAQVTRAVKLVTQAGRYCTVLSEDCLWVQREPDGGGSYVDVAGLLADSNPTGYVLHALNVGRRSIDPDMPRFAPRGKS